MSNNDFHHLPKVEHELPGAYDDSMTQFYPDWKGAGSGKRLHDGNAPTYMKKGKYIKESLASCCKRWYSWDVHTCMGDSGEVLNNFYLPRLGNSGYQMFKCHRD